MLLIPLILLMCITRSLALEENIAEEIRKKYDKDKLRILVLDFTHNSKKDKSVQLAKIIREQFISEKIFAILNIEEINNQIVSRNFKKDGFDNQIKFVSYLGKKLKGNQIALIGDNQDVSRDSRYFGAIDGSLVKGKVLWVAFAVNKGIGVNYPRIGKSLR